MTRRRRGELGRVAARALARVYFDISYGLLAGSAAGRRLLELTAAGDEPVHGYFTIEDRDVLLAGLDPAPGDRLLDLGCGIGGIAVEVHRRTGAEIVGVDVSPRAVAAATRRARRAGVGAAVRFVNGDLARPPLVGATSAYAIDSLMFLPDLAGALRGIGEALESGGRLFATLLVVGPGSADRLDRSFRAAGVRVERIDDVTAGLDVRSRARAGAARALLRQRGTTPRGLLAMLLVLGEEALVRTLIAKGRIGRWRFVVSSDRSIPAASSVRRSPRSGSAPKRSRRCAPLIAAWCSWSTAHAGRRRSGRVAGVPRPLIARPPWCRSSSRGTP